MEKKEILKGISQKEAEDELKKYGYNEIREIMRISPLRILFRQIKKNFIYKYLKEH